MHNEQDELAKIDWSISLLQDEFIELWIATFPHTCNLKYGVKLLLYFETAVSISTLARLDAKQTRI